MIAKLYYSGNQSQQEIADLMGISRMKVSRLLKESREKNIVEFSYNSPPLLREEMVSAIRDQLQLKNVYIVKSEANRAKTKASIGRAAAGILSQTVSDNACIGIVWGTTSYQLVKQFIPIKQVSGCKVVQLTGGMFIPGINLDASDTVRTLAERLNATWHLLQAPMIVQNTMTKKCLMQEPEVLRHFSLFEDISLAVVGLGSNVPERSVSYLGGYITLDESRYLIDSGAAADICGHRLTQDGKLASTFLNDRIMSIKFETLQQIPFVLGVGEGSDKASSIIAGAHGGILKAIVIDELAAIAVLKLVRHPSLVLE